MKRRSSILVVAGISIGAIVSVVAISTHLRLSALEGVNNTNESSHSESEETPEERAAEGK